MNPCDIRLYGILDTQITRGNRLAEHAVAAARGGVTILQYRAKQTGTAEMIAEARLVLAALAGSGVPLLINDRVDVALVSGAQGVHLGREDMHPADARALLGPKAIIGATVKNKADLALLAGQPIDYACIGGVFATVHKDNPDPPLGVAKFQKLRDKARERLGNLPVGAIAGIDTNNAASLIVAGADGVAVIGALFAQPDITAAAQSLLRSIALGRSY
jgi:thiamine-phosphate pyrophosphorylase